MPSDRGLFLSRRVNRALRRERGARRCLPLLGIPLITACGILGIGDDDVGLKDHPTLVATLQGDGVVRFDARDASVIARFHVPGTEGVGDYIQDPVMVPFDEAVIGGGGRDPEPTVIYFSVADFRALWHEPYREVEERSGGIDLRASFRRSSPNGREILYAPSTHLGQRGIAALDPDTRSARMLHAGSLHPSRVEVLTRGTYAPNGAVLVHAGREGRYELDFPTHLFVVDAENGSVLDSIPPSDLPEVDDLDRFVSGFDARTVLFWAGTGFHVYDLPARSTVGWVPASSAYNRAVFDPRSERFALYTRGLPTSGIVQVFDEDLQRTDIDLREVEVEGPYPPSIRGVAFGENGQIFILSGETYLTFHAFQDVRIIVADVETGEVTRVHELPLDGNPLGLFYSPAQR